MTRLNSRLTYLAKYAFPAVWFGFLAFFMVMAPFSTNDPMKITIFMIAPIPMAFFGYFLMRKIMFQLVNEVYRSGDEILCRSGQKQARFPLSDIQSALYYTQSQPPKCVLRLRRPTDFGRDIEFMPKVGWRIFSYNADVERLIDDVDRLNQK